MKVKTAFSLFSFGLIWFVQLFLVDLKVGYEKFIQRLTSLPSICMNFAIGYFILTIFQMFKPSKISKKFLDTLFIITFSLTVLSVSAHWYLDSIDPELTFGETLEPGTLDYYCGIFIYGGNIGMLFWYSIGIEKFTRISIKVIFCFNFVFLFWYASILVITKIVSGKFPYKFIERYGLDEYLHLFAVLITINIFSVVIFYNIIQSQIKLKQH